jgi:hypothetical protein
LNKLTTTTSTSTLNSLKLVAAKLNLTVEEAASEMMERGVKDFIYRSQRNARKWQETKDMKDRLAQLEEQLAGSKHPDTYKGSDWDLDNK